MDPHDRLPTACFGCCALLAHSMVLPQSCEEKIYYTNYSAFKSSISSVYIIISTALVFNTETHTLHAILSFS